MAFDVLKKTAEYKNKQKKIKLKQKIMTVLTLIVVFCTVYALILPAITFDGNVKRDGDSAARIQYTIQHFLWFNDVNRESMTIGSNSSGTNSDYDSIITNTETKKEAQLPFIDQTKGIISSTDSTAMKAPKDLLKVKIEWKNGGNYGLGNNNIGSGSIWDVVTTRKLVRLFGDEEAYYRQKPQINYMNRLYNNDVDRNPNYKITEVWIGSKSNAESVNENDFTIYKLFNENGVRVVKPDEIRFTNNPQNQHINVPGNPHTPGVNGWDYAYTILITNDTVVRFVFEPVEEDDVESDACFYDYDITDGKVYTRYNNGTFRGEQNTSYQQSHPNATLYAKTNQQGINNPNNYKDANGNQLSGTKYAFGNSNAGTGLGALSWKGNTLNRANSSYRGITYGLVSGILYDEYKKEDGTTVKIPTPVFSDGIAAPDLFGSSEVIGKSAYINNEYGLGFKRVGGTYVLDYVKNNTTKEKSADDLSRFTMTYDRSKDNANNKGRIWANRFWPMDDAPSFGTDGHDLKFGNSTDADKRKLLNDAGNEANFPGLDAATPNRGINSNEVKSADHNSYFGMSFSLDFTIQPGFCAPLNYWFYGDDDVWVFVQEIDADGNLTGDAKLIADIGGVHSSTGIYVNLWECGAVQSVPYGGEAKSYRLTVFYTERGASGSSCYMRITVPLSTYVAPPQERDEALLFEKVLLDDERNEIYDEIADTDEGNAIYDSEGNLVCDANGEKVKVNENNKVFSFTLQLHDKDGVAFQDMYDYAVYSRKYCPDHTAENAVPLRTGTIPKAGQGGYEDGHKYKFTLRGGEYIVITNLPDDVWFTIREDEYIPAANESGYVTQNEVGTHKHVDGQQVDTIEISKRYSLVAGDPAYNINQYNYVRYTNGPAIKTEFETDKNPGVGDTVHVGDEIIYEIEWGNSGNDVSIKIEDFIQKGLDFVDAAFGSISDYSRKNGNKTDGFPWANIIENGGMFTSTNGNTITYDRVNKKVTWNIDHFDEVKDENDGEHKTVISGTVTLKVRVNEDAMEKIESGDKITNEATLNIGDRHIITNKTENPVWDPVKTEVSPGENKPVGVGDVITYQVTWKNYLNGNAVVVIRDPLDVNVSYVIGTQKVWIIGENGVEYEMPQATFEERKSDGKTELVWILPEQASGAHGYVEFQVKVLESAVVPGQVVNTAYVKVGNDPELDTNLIKNPVFGVDLPRTGGIGTTLFTLGGMAIMLGSLMAICVIGYKRRKYD